MTVKEFVKLDMGGLIFKVVDATRNGYMVKPYALAEADKNVLKRDYGNYEIVGFDIEGRRRVGVLYVKERN